MEPIRIDNKVRLSADVLDKAQAIADEWGLQNAKAAVEAVFRKYADDYMYGRQPQFNVTQPPQAFLPQIQPQPIGFQPKPIGTNYQMPLSERSLSERSLSRQTEIPLSQAASELDGLLGL
jgi:hypothetical protein